MTVQLVYTTSTVSFLVISIKTPLKVPRSHFIIHGVFILYVFSQCSHWDASRIDMDMISADKANIYRGW
jgi:hypothetical protein